MTDTNRKLRVKAVNKRAVAQWRLGPQEANTMKEKRMMPMIMKVEVLSGVDYALREISIS